jgi:hypothetical protein
MDGKPLEKLEILFLGEGNLYYFKGTTKDGKMIETLYVKGTI